jgi:GH25 family lysozyme M1 (1,4-beta-N-acetylmuramidase)
MFPDISEFQGAVDWDALGAAYIAGQIEAVAMRAGFGTVRADAQFARNQSECRARGIPAIYYWFNYPDTNLPEAEAAMFNSVVGPLQANEAMVGDFEDDGAHLFPRGQAGVDWARAFLTAIEAPQNASWWYTYPYLLSVIPFQQLYGVWPFWIADYSATPDSAFSQAIARQFTNCGATPGVAGCCDQSRVLGAPLSQWLTGGDDMFTDADRATLNAIFAALANKQSPFLVPARKTVFISGPNQDTQWNVCPQDQPTAVTIFCYDVRGTVLGTAVPDLLPNRPNVGGPVPGYGTAARLGATGPCTLGFENNGPGDVWVTLH